MTAAVVIIGANAEMCHSLLRFTTIKGLIAIDPTGLMNELSLGPRGVTSLYTGLTHW